MGGLIVRGVVESPEEVFVFLLATIGARHNGYIFWAHASLTSGELFKIDIFVFKLPTAERWAVGLTRQLTKYGLLGLRERKDRIQGILSMQL